MSRPGSIILYGNGMKISPENIINESEDETEEPLWIMKLMN